MGWLYTFHFSLESVQPIIILVFICAFTSVFMSVCVCVCVWLEIQEEDLTLSLLQLIETGLVYKLSFSCLFTQFVYACLCVFVDMCAFIPLCLIMQVLLTAVVRSCSLHLASTGVVCSHLCMCMCVSALVN